MKVVIFGANGKVGRSAVEQALAQGHEVTAAVRNPASLSITHERLRVVTCDVFEPAAVSQAIAGQDAVVCTLGINTRGPISLYSTGARNVLQGMQAHQVPRLVFLSNFGVLDETASDLRGKIIVWLAKRFIRTTLEDHRRALEDIKRQAIDWIVVRPMGLTNGPHTGQYRIALEGLPDKGMNISRADVADFMLRQLSSNEYVKKIPAIAY